MATTTPSTQSPQVTATDAPSTETTVLPTTTSTPKNKTKSRRRLPRARRAGEDDDEEDAADDGSDASDSLSDDDDDDSDSSQSGDEDEEHEETTQEAPKEKPAPPTAWADITDAVDEVDPNAPSISLDEFNRQGLDAPAAVDAAVASTSKQRKPAEDDEAKRARAQAKRERVKAKRQAAKLAKKQAAKEAMEQQPAASSSKSAGEASSSPPKGKRSKAKEAAEATNKSAVADESPAPADAKPHPPAAPPARVSNRQAYLAKISSDPSFVPRVGRFWTHDERHYAAGKFGQGDSEYSGLREMSDYWRARGFRGRGRGFAMMRGGPAFRGRGGMPFAPQATAPVKPAVANPKVPPTPTTAEEPAQTADATVHSATPASDAPVKVTVPAFGKGKWGAGTNPDTERDWNHDGYLQLAQEDERRASQRARGRGRGGFVHPRGAFAARGGRGGRFVPPQTAMQPSAAPTTESSAPVIVKLPQSAPSATGAPPTFEGVAAESAEPAQPTVAASMPASVAGDVTTGPVASGPAADEDVAVNPHSTSAPPDIAPPVGATADISSLQLQAEYAALRQQQELIRQKELRLQEEMRRLEIEQQLVRSGPASAALYAVPPTAGSDNGSIGSGSASAMVPPLVNNGTMLPPGVAMTETGSFYEISTGQPVVFVPTPSPGPSGPVNGYAPQDYRGPAGASRPPYYPQQSVGAPYYQPPMTPDYATQRVPSQQHRHSSSGASYYTTGGPGGPMAPMAGRESPYQAPPPGPGYFALPRQNSRIQIRAPSQSGTPSEEMASAVLKKQPHDRKSSLSTGYRPDQNGIMYGAPEYGGGYPQQPQDPSQSYYAQAPQYPGPPQQYPTGAYGEYGYNGQYGGY